MDNQVLYNVRVTMLEKFRRFMTSGEDDKFDNEAALIETLSGKFEGNDKTYFGSAFHKIVEYPQLFQQDGETIIDLGDKKVLVPYNVAKVACEHSENHPYMVSEVSMSKVYDTGKYKVQVFGTADGIEGKAVRDTKTKYRSMKATDYMESFQWRFYLDMLGLEVFYYDVFEIKYFDGLKQMDATYVPMITTGRDKKPRPLGIIQHEPITCTGYLAMHKQCEGLIEQFMEYIEIRNFFHFLKTVPYEASVL